MHPILFSIGNFEIHTYGFLAALAYFISIFWAAREGKKVGIKPEYMMDIGFYILLFSVLGGRLLYVITDFSSYLDEPHRIFKIWEGGLVFYGALLGACLASCVYIKLKKLKFYLAFDILVQCFAMNFIGRLACYSAGCCYGKPTDLPWAVQFPIGSAAPSGVNLHPVQLYSAVSEFMLLIFLMRLYRNRKFTGQTTLMYFILYPVIRFILEFWRDDYRGSIGFLSTSQFIGIPIFLIAIYYYKRYSQPDSK